MNGLSKVSPLLLVPPVAVGIAELSFNIGRVDVAAVLANRMSVTHRRLEVGETEIDSALGAYHVRVFDISLRNASSLDEASASGQHSSCPERRRAK